MRCAQDRFALWAGPEWTGGDRRPGTEKADWEIWILQDPVITLPRTVTRLHMSLHLILSTL